MINWKRKHFMAKQLHFAFNRINLNKLVQIAVFSAVLCSKDQQAKRFLNKMQTANSHAMTPMNYYCKRDIEGERKLTYFIVYESNKCYLQSVDKR